MSTRGSNVVRKFRYAHRHGAVTLALLSAVVAASGSTAHAADDPLSGVDGELKRAAAKILATAKSGQPLRVVVTSRTAGAPSIVGTTVDTEAEAVKLITSGLSKASTIGVDIAHTVRITATNDTFRSQQWALNRFRAETVWKTSTGAGVVIAVVDTGVTASHPDLAGHVLAGKDFVAPGTAATDQNGHGTHVAGIANAIANNGRGIAGLARFARILPVRVLGADGSGSSDDVASGIIWATNHGAKVINLSLGSSQSDNASKAAVAYAVSKNVVVVAAAGNDGCGGGLLGLGGPTISYPAAYSRVLGVGAIQSNGSLAPYSNCGSYVDVVAPGSGIISTMITNPDSGLGCTPGTGYCTLSGTSMATPYAAAAAALEIDKLGRGTSQVTVRGLIQATADDIEDSGRDDLSGHGVINPLRMLAAR